MDKNEFFRQATLCICGNLEVDEAMFNCLPLLRKVMPVDVLYLELFEVELNAMRVIAMASQSEHKKVNWLTPISGEAILQFRKETKNFPNGVYFTKIPAPEKLSMEMLNHLKVSATSLMVLKLESNGQILGTLVVISKGDKPLTKHHADLLALLREPFSIAMSNALKHREVIQLKDMLSDDNRYLRQEMRHLTGDEIIGANFGLRDVMEKVHHVAALDTPVLLLGETGVGKDIIANTIHFLSLRKDAPFIKVNCGAIPDSLIDSELFGHEKGAFTGAMNLKKGRFERANKGTIFLDEIGELPPQAQVRLLNVLQDKDIERVGSEKTIKLDIRIIAATNKNLEEMVRKNNFREDLWFRINVFPIWIPPLRQRKSDIPALLQHFINQKAKELKLSAIPEVAAGSINSLMNYDWPGNVRELQNVVEHALIINPEGPVIFKNLNPGQQNKTTYSIENNKAIEKLDVITARYIERVLNETGGKIHGPDGAAEILGINPNTLRHRMKKLGIRYGRSKK